MEYSQHGVPAARLPPLPLGFVGVFDGGDDPLTRLAVEVVDGVDQGQQLLVGVLLWEGDRLTLID